MIYISIYYIYLISRLVHRIQAHIVQVTGSTITTIRLEQKIWNLKLFCLSFIFVYFWRLMSRLNFAQTIWLFTKLFSSREQLSGPKPGTTELLLLTEFNVSLTANKNHFLSLRLSHVLRSLVTFQPCLLDSQKLG